MLSLSLYNMLKLFKTPTPQKLFAYDCVTLYVVRVVMATRSIAQFVFAKRDSPGSSAMEKRTFLSPVFRGGEVLLTKIMIFSVVFYKIWWFPNVGHLDENQPCHPRISKVYLLTFTLQGWVTKLLFQDFIYSFCQCFGSLSFWFGSGSVSSGSFSQKIPTFC